MMDYCDFNNVNAEFERIFGVEHRPTLFDGNPGYDQFRHLIINAPKCEVNNDKLPFEDFHLMSYEEYSRMEILKGFEKRHLKIFYIRKYEGEKLVCYGAGYFNITTARFVIIRLSYSQVNEYHKLLLESIPSLKTAFADNYFTLDNGRIQLEKQLPFDSASLAASFIIGNSASFKEWKDKEGKTLDFYYNSKYDSLFVDSNGFACNFISENFISNNSNKSIKKEVKIGIRNVISSLQNPFNNLISSLQTPFCKPN